MLLLVAALYLNSAENLQQKGGDGHPLGQNCASKHKFF